jgi:hypothetical protein
LGSPSGSRRASFVDVTPDELLRALADPERLAIAGSLARAPRTAGDLARALHLPLDRVRRHLSRLTSVGVVRADTDRRTYRLVPQTLRDAAKEVGPPREPGVALGAVFEDEQAVLRHFLVGGRLREIPAKRSKRLVVLNRLALEFDIGVRYREREVNDILKRFLDDYAGLRRYLVDEGLLSREGGRYWRTGGPVQM